MLFLKANLGRRVCVILKEHVVTHFSYSNRVVMKDSLLEQPVNDGMDYWGMFNFTLSSLRLNNSKYKKTIEMVTMIPPYQVIPLLNERTAPNNWGTQNARLPDTRRSPQVSPAHQGRDGRLPNMCLSAPCIWFLINMNRITSHAEFTLVCCVCCLHLCVCVCWVSK